MKWKRLSGLPVTIGLDDRYTSVERGFVEGIYFLFPVFPNFKGENLFKVHTRSYVSCRRPPIVRKGLRKILADEPDIVIVEKAVDDSEWSGKAHLHTSLHG